MDNKISIDPHLAARFTKYPDRLAAIERDYDSATRLALSFQVDRQGQLNREIDRFAAQLREYHLSLYLCDERAKILASELRADLVRLSKQTDSGLVSSTIITLESELGILDVLRLSIEDSLAFAKQARKNLKTISETCNLAALIRLCKSWSDYTTESRMK